MRQCGGPAIRQSGKAAMRCCGNAAMRFTIHRTFAAMRQNGRGLCKEGQSHL
ncbi:MAG: hypothetical protein GY820_31700 [Gammaproteobacteria bacterium]|nr:hypothetical protein [Gammaproteobacteria bacterium]